MNTEINIEIFHRILLTKADDFRKFWLAKHSENLKDPNDYPYMLELNDWFEQYEAWLELTE